LGYERKERRERDNDFDEEKGDRLFLPWISFSLPLLSLPHDFHRKKLYPRTEGNRRVASCAVDESGVHGAFSV